MCVFVCACFRRKEEPGVDMSVNACACDSSIPGCLSLALSCSVPWRKCRMDGLCIYVTFSSMTRGPESVCKCAFVGRP